MVRFHLIAVGKSYRNEARRCLDTLCRHVKAQVNVYCDHLALDSVEKWPGLEVRIIPVEELGGLCTTSYFTAHSYKHLLYRFSANSGWNVFIDTDTSVLGELEARLANHTGEIILISRYPEDMEIHPTYSLPGLTTEQQWRMTLPLKDSAIRWIHGGFFCWRKTPSVRLWFSVAYLTRLAAEAAYGTHSRSDEWGLTLANHLCFGGQVSEIPWFHRIFDEDIPDHGFDELSTSLEESGVVIVHGRKFLHQLTSSGVATQRRTIQPEEI